jgi:hypothetical protein
MLLNKSSLYWGLRGRHSDHRDARRPVFLALAILVFALVATASAAVASVMSSGTSGNGSEEHQAMVISADLNPVDACVTRRAHAPAVSGDIIHVFDYGTQLPTEMSLREYCSELVTLTSQESPEGVRPSYNVENGRVVANYDDPVR